MNSFKPGDWVRYKGIAQINSITHTGYHLSNGYITKGDNGEMKLWQPKLGEWVWSKGSYTQAFIFKWTSSHEQAGIINYTNYEPFIGQLPTYLKDQS